MTNIQREDIEAIIADLAYNGPLVYAALRDGFTPTQAAYNQRTHDRFRFAFSYLKDHLYIIQRPLPHGTLVWSINAAKVASVVQARSSSNA